MNETKPSIKKMLKDVYEKACNGYLTELLRMWELDGHYGYWSGDEPGTIYHYGETHNLNMEEIIFCVDNDIEEDEVLQWEDYCLDAMEFNMHTPNIRAWHHGCPRTSPEAFARLRQLKKDLEEAVANEKLRVRKEESGTEEPYSFIPGEQE